ncbi:hypothetical protein Moror_8786 [Moniliophthora roreri MCA 2997]|uniref:Uncharacterized protein n=1 Tax=Moniliophthora roreri (strain MCA 2997) TaxID=1381753 RepID=V2WSZ1_MONRO|nr:hypothetical protein Moror_8786 [Moniliophthora roreri MCA 2997]
MNDDTIMNPTITSTEENNSYLTSFFPVSFRTSIHTLWSMVGLTVNEETTAEQEDSDNEGAEEDEMVHLPGHYTSSTPSHEKVQDVGPSTLTAEAFALTSIPEPETCSDDLVSSNETGSSLEEESMLLPTPGYSDIITPYPARPAPDFTHSPVFLGAVEDLEYAQAQKRTAPLWLHRKLPTFAPREDTLIHQHHRSSSIWLYRKPRKSRYGVVGATAPKFSSLAQRYGTGCCEFEIATKQKWDTADPRPLKRMGSTEKTHSLLKAMHIWCSANVPAGVLVRESRSRSQGHCYRKPKNLACHSHDRRPLPLDLKPPSVTLARHPPFISCCSRRDGITKRPANDPISLDVDEYLLSSAQICDPWTSMLNRSMCCVPDPSWIMRCIALMLMSTST